MALHRAQLNMNKPSSADTPAKPNSACRHHCRTEQEAPDPLLACTNELQRLPCLTIKALFQSQLPIKRNIMALNNPAVVFFPSCLSILGYCCDKRCIQDNLELRERGGILVKGASRGFGGETGFLESSCLFSEGSEAVMMIGCDACLVAAACCCFKGS